MAMTVTEGTGYTFLGLLPSRKTTAEQDSGTGVVPVFTGALFVYQLQIQVTGSQKNHF